MDSRWALLVLNYLPAWVSDSTGVQVQTRLFSFLYLRPLFCPLQSCSHNETVTSSGQDKPIKSLSNHKFWIAVVETIKSHCWVFHKRCSPLCLLWGLGFCSAIWKAPAYFRLKVAKTGELEILELSSYLTSWSVIGHEITCESLLYFKYVMVSLLYWLSVAEGCLSYNMLFYLNLVCKLAWPWLSEAKNKLTYSFLKECKFWL